MLCPKCHQPLEDDGELYICCAEAAVEWRCRQCDKVSEGFAFPYGMCPHCGGKLAPLAPRSIEDEAALEAIRTAFEIELGGQAFYHRAALQAEDDTLKALFGKLAEMEKEHMEILSRRYHAKVPSPTDGFRVDLAAINAGIGVRPEDPANLFKIAIAFEERAAAFFAERAELAAQGSPERQLHRELAAEEREHIATLKTEFKRWQAGKPGLL